MSSVVKIIQPSGVLDGSHASAFRRLVSEGAAGATMVLVDFKDVTFMDSSGLGALVLARKSIVASGAQIYICSLNSQIKMLFELTSMDQVFKIFSDQEEFKKNILL